MAIVYVGQLIIAGNIDSSAAFTAIEELPDLGYFLLNPWLHSTHNHIFQNTLLFALFGAWTERKTGTETFVIGVIIIGYTTNLATGILGIGGFGIGISGITNALETYFVLFQLAVYSKAMKADPAQYRKAAMHIVLFFIALILVLKSILEFVGYITPNPGVATGAHFIGVVMGAAWFTSKYLGPKLREQFSTLALFG
jgi:membrane associated rhomboid family serine protease